MIVIEIKQRVIRRITSLKIKRRKNMYYDSISKQNMEMSITLFKTHCNINNVRIKTEKLFSSDIPSNVPFLMKKFYEMFAPVSIEIDQLGVKFFPYQKVFEMISHQQSDLRFIPIAFYNNDVNQTAYIDRNNDGSWDLRVQLPIGNGKVSILGEDVFDYLIQLCKMMQPQF